MARTLSSLAIGALVKETGTTYYGKPIIWKIADKNHLGYPANSVTLIADKILTIKCYDAKEASNSNNDRRSFGNNRYIYSNLRQWLNSDKAAGTWYTAQHGQDAPPTYANVEDNYNEYAAQAGFLTGFSASLKAVLLPTALAVVRNTITDGGGSESVTDKAFLASNTEVGLTHENGITEGSIFALFSDTNSRPAYPTADAVTNSGYTHANLHTGAAWRWWLRTPEAAGSCLPRAVAASGALGSDYAYRGHTGVRPLINLPSDILVSDSMGADGAYTIAWNQPPTAPGSITYGTPRAAKPLDLTLTAATDPD